MPSDLSLERLVRRPVIRYSDICLTASAWAILGVSIGLFAGRLIRSAFGTDTSDFVSVEHDVLAASFGFLAILAARLPYVVVFLIRLYQRYADAEVRLRCRQTPTCSEFAIFAVLKYGAVVGVWKTVARLRRCRPPGRIDFP